ncbi:MAG TPA: chorismate-binding protein [Aquabacterium sp.]|nr:chorismate-binding protein [Aquabacterium sp.]
MTRAAAALIDFPSGPAGAPNLPQDGRTQHAFFQPLTWLVAHRLQDVPSVIDQAHQHARSGHWCVGWVAYEAAVAFDAHLPTHPPQSDLPLAAFAVFDVLQPWPELPIEGWETASWTTELTPQTFADKVRAIHDLIRAGEVYQINLTSPLRNQLSGTNDQAPLAYFGALRRAQPRGFNVYMDLTQAARDGSVAWQGQGVSHLLSVSPELFFHWDQGLLVSRPMKGTAARGETAEADRKSADHLRSSIKERAENLMIVDLLRNDLSRVAQTGSVQVPSLFDVQALPTVWQMTSTIEARTRAEVGLSDIFRALFPCGSITGAPKQRAMHHIVGLELEPRGAYCGALGVIQPGGTSTFNVGIRTVELSGQQTTPPHRWSAKCGIGSGITLDATAGGEAMEWHHKQAFLRRAARPFELLESLRLENGQLARLPLHVTRLRQAAQHFDIPLDENKLQKQLAQLQDHHPAGVFKVRVLVSANGGIRVEASALPANPPSVKVSLAQAPMPLADEFIWHKTTRRDAYQPHTPQQGAFDTLLFNRAGELTEFTIGNVAIELDGQWWTPPLSCGLLPGVMRQTLLSQGQLKERVITLDELTQATGLALINSVREWLPVELMLSTSPQ